MSKTASSKAKWIFFIPVIIAIVIFVNLKQNKMDPQRSEPQERITAVRSIEVPKLSVIPIATGYGTVQPAKTWSAISQVKGNIVYKNPKLEKGTILKAGELLLEVDPTDYQLNIAQTQADIAATQAQLDELTAKEKNTRASLAIENNSLKLTEKELQRQKKLVKKGSVSFSDVEKQERTRLGQQQSVQNQRNTLNLIPAQRASLKAQLQRQEVQLKTLERDLQQTRITLPFNGRVAQVNFELTQYVRDGENLADIDGLEKAEIEVQIPINEMQALIQSNQALDAENLNHEQLRKRLSLQAEVFLNEGGTRVSWPANFARFSDTLDPKTRTVGAIVEVDRPYANIQPGLKPPLVKGLFVEVKISGTNHPDSIVIPNVAIHHNSDTDQQQVYLINAEGRLEIRPIQILLSQEQFSLVKSGLSGQEQLVLSELLPAVKNMRLKAQPDALAQQRLIQAVQQTSTTSGM